MATPTAEDRERVRLLGLVSSSKSEFKMLTADQLRRLGALLEKKDYGHDKRARRSKEKLLKRINVRIYELEEGRGIWG